MDVQKILTVRFILLQVTQRFIMMINLLAEDEEGTEVSEGEGEE